MQYLQGFAKVSQAAFLRLTHKNNHLKNKRMLALSSMASLLAACGPAGIGTGTGTDTGNGTGTGGQTDTAYLNVIANNYNDASVVDRWNSLSTHKAVGTIVFYQFNEKSANGNYDHGAVEANFAAFNENQRQMARDIIQEASDQFGVIFVEIAPDDTSITANIIIDGNLVMTGDISGYAATPGLSGGLTIKLDATLTNKHFIEIFHHELGHSLGLKHPFADRGPIDAITDSAQVAANTVMSYFYDPASSQFLSWDVQALTHLYGTKAEQVVLYSYENGKVTVTGTANDDIFAGSTLNDVIHAGDGNDFVYSSYGDDIIYGGNGNDILDGGYGKNKLYGEAGDDILVYSNYSIDNLYDGGTGTDTVSAENWVNDAYIILTSTSTQYISIENVIGSKFNDVIFGDDATNIIDGRKGDDLIYSSKGGDLIIGGEGRDIFLAYSADVTYSIDKSGGKINVKYVEFGSNITTQLQSIELLRSAGTTQEIDIASIWSDLISADQTAFNNDSDAFSSWLTSDYGYENIA